MSNLSKGKSYEREVVKILEKQGWMIEKAINKTVWNKGKVFSIAHDFFGMFDIIAKKAGHTTRWIQVSTWEMSSVKRNKLSSLNWTTDYDSVEIWARMRHQRIPHFRVLHSDDGFEWRGGLELILK